MQLVTSSQVVFINWQQESAFRGLQLNLLFFSHLSIYCYLLKHVASVFKILIASVQVYLLVIKHSNPTVNKLGPTYLTAVKKSSSYYLQLLIFPGSIDTLLFKIQLFWSRTYQHYMRHCLYMQ